MLRGQVPEARHDLASVAEAVAMFRQASLDSPRPSAELALRLDLERAARLSASVDGLHASTAAWSPVNNEAPTPGTRRRRVALTGFAGLGLAAKIAIGAVAASAVGVAGAGAAGAVGVLPTQADMRLGRGQDAWPMRTFGAFRSDRDRKSTRQNSSH